MKKIISLFLTIMLLCSGTFASTIKTSDYTTLIKNGLINHVSLLGLETSVAQLDDLIKQTGGSSDTATLLGLHNKKAQLSRSIATVRNKITYELTVLYMQYLQLESSISLMNEQLELEKIAYDTATTQYNNGILSKNRFETLQLNYEKLVINKNKQLRTLDTLKKTLNKMSGFKVTESIVYDQTLPIKLTDFSKLTLEDATTQALRNRNEIRTARENFETAEMIFDLTTTNMELDTPQWRTAKYDFLIAENQLFQTEMDMRKNIETLYREYETSFEALTIATRNQEIEEKALEEIVLLHKQGKVTAATLNQAKLSMAVVKQTQNQAIWDHYFANYILQVQIGIGGADNE